MGRIGSVPLLVILLLLLACSFPLIVQALPSPQSLPGFLLLQSSLDVFMALLFFQATSVQILRDSILTRVTVRGVHQTGSLKNCASSMYYLNHFLFYIELIRYYQCVNGKPYEHTCQAGLRWNQALTACDWSSNVQCPSAPMAIQTSKRQALPSPQSFPGSSTSSSSSTFIQFIYFHIIHFLIGRHLFHINTKHQKKY